MWNRQNKTDRRILAAATLLLLLMLYLLYDDSLILPSDNTSNLKPIGKISQLDRDVRRKVSKKFVWRTARHKDTLHAGDSLFTGKDSVVKVELKDGRSLTLQENSLIVFNTSGDQLNLDLRAGRLQGKLDGCVKINIKGQEKEICGENSPIEIDSDGAVEVKKEEAPKEEIIWAQAPQKSFFHYKNNTPLKLSWKASKPFGRFRVQFSRQKDFKIVAYEEKTLSPSIETRGYPVMGTYFVRVQGDDLKGRPAGFSKLESIEIREVAAPRITSPTPKQLLTFRTDADGELIDINQVEFQWKYPLNNVKFDLEIARDAKFTDPVALQKNLAGLKALSEPLATGEYFARVRDAAVTENVHRPWSNPVPFKVQIADPVKLQAPQLITRRIQYLAPDPEPIKFVWTPVQSAHHYVVEMSATEDFAEKKTLTTPTNSLVLEDQMIAPGKAFFRVYSSTQKGTRSAPSSMGAMLVKLKRPTIIPAEPLVVQGKTPEDPGDPQNVPVAWSDLKYAEQYELQVATDPGFKNKVEVKTSTPASTVTMPKPGDYFVRVRALGAGGKPVTRFSEVQPMKYILKVPLATPVILEPFDQVTLFFQKSSSPYIWLEWKDVRQASLYNIEVATDPNFETKVLTATTKSRRYLIKKALPSQVLYWRVQAEGDDKRTSFWTQTRSMTVFTGKATNNRLPAGKRKPAGKRR